MTAPGDIHIIDEERSAVSMTRLAIIGLGSIGGSVLEHIVRKPMKRIEVVAACECRDIPENIAALLSDGSIPLVRKIEDIPSHGPDYVLEAASQEVVQKYAVFFLKRGISLITLSTGGLYAGGSYGEIMSHCSPAGPRIIIPSGAVGGLDIVRAAAMGKIESVHLKTTKPAGALEQANGELPAANVTEGPAVLFSGTADEAAKLFPKNINVAMVLALAGIGPEKTTVEIIADPACTINTHQLSISGDFGSAEVTLKNRPSPANPRSSLLAIYSTISILDQIDRGLLPGA